VHVIFRTALAVLTVAMLLGCYVAAYLWSLDTGLTILTGVGPWNLRPHYIVGGPAAEVFFYPIHALDRRVRRDCWRLADDAWDEDEFVRASDPANN